jgi:omega-amidase
MKIALCQFDIAWENKAANHARVDALLDGASNLCRDALIVLPEMFSTGFSMDVATIREGEERISEAYLAATAKRFKAHVLGGVVNRGPDGKGCNESVTFGPDGKLVARYQKMQPFTLSGEMACYAPGKDITLFECSGMRVAPFVCYDLRFPELFRHAAQLGAQLIVDIANWPVTRIDHWITLLRARAIENQAYVVGVNRVGRDPKYVYNGRSLIVNPHGEIIADAGNGECVIGAELDPQLVINWRKDFPALDDIRSEYSIRA